MWGLQALVRDKLHHNFLIYCKYAGWEVGGVVSSSASLGMISTVYKYYPRPNQKQPELFVYKARMVYSFIGLMFTHYKHLDILTHLNQADMMSYCKV